MKPRSWRRAVARRQVAQEAKHELRTLTEQGRQELKSQAEAQTQRASQNLRTWSDQTRALAGRPTKLARSQGTSKTSRESSRVGQTTWTGGDSTAWSRRSKASLVGAQRLSSAVRRGGVRRQQGGQDRAVRAPRRGQKQPMLPPAATSPESISGPTTDAAVV